MKCLKCTAKLKKKNNDRLLLWSNLTIKMRKEII